MYQVNFGSATGAFGVPNSVVDEHLRLSGALSLKVLLVLLRQGKPMSIEELAESLSQNQGDVKDALNQWIQVGLVVPMEEGISLEKKSLPAVEVGSESESTQMESSAGTNSPGCQTPMLQTSGIPLSKRGVEDSIATDPMPLPERKLVAFVPAAQEKKEKTLTQKNELPKPTSSQPMDNTPKVRMERFRRMTRHDVLEIAGEDTTIGVIIDEAQNILARPLSNGESEMLISFYHYYGLDADILLMLLTYCKMEGKDSAGYIEKMASDWVNREINTHERAEAELMRLTQKDEDETKLRRVFGIGDRKLTKRETEFYKTWTTEYSFDDKMISLANERTIDQKGKMSFPYTNAILKAWHQKGFTKPSEAEQEGLERQEKGKGKDKSGVNSSDASYDLDKLDDMITHGSVWD